ncbi:DNA-directed RNA polymerase subunit alpha C-terminal domain-containing protein [Singulisphaera acidiphila]|uniref:DNA-directed RNA polymerase, alpha subunit/40 kD subunit n=1 Tax=Singulisphaera acidiphila (strain ATCC BAA-1392 / DSM 18658 / VKM B-2454 / MOB10) TaxID=886293 RepID=L0DLP5_SINAD|nr:DNA-directed RNA polymerase subunit alpha C-terminal domain-containing protein [Singulisphaera acidiphila]AGA29763.1 DNA-directed RNA polymerase, alpha subunit/40 kD subunit [Singulisphaera acidiphila DSM 18658]
MAELMTTDVRALLDRQPFDHSAVADLREVLGRDPSRYRTLRDAVAAMKEREKEDMKPDIYLRVGLGEVLLGRYKKGLEQLTKAGDVGLAHFHRGIALANLQRWTEAAEAFAAASAAGYDTKQAELHRAGALRRGGHVEAAQTILGGLANLDGSSAEYHYQRGSLLAADGELADASVEFEKALSLDRDHTGALFELAYINDLFGNDETAVEYYKRCTQRPPVPLAALINLGVLYEDEMRFREAEACYRQVLAFDPNHPRARLFFKDCRASKDMYYDEEAERGFTVLKQLLEIPVTDFELSVRSRNCLRKMNIRTLGDLTRTTEAALLASKNFGETSLSEIKEMMTSKGLRLGMALEGGERATNDLRAEPIEELSQEEKALLAKSISDLNLSVRARKCMTKLGIQTVGELIIHTGDELMECKNFGVTSLNEVREKLTEFNLKLKNE